MMLNRIVPLTALLLALGAAPALAQSGEDTTAARTMAQNRKVFIGRLPPPQAAAIPARHRRARRRSGWKWRRKPGARRPGNPRRHPPRRQPS